MNWMLEENEKKMQKIHPVAIEWMEKERRERENEKSILNNEIYCLQRRMFHFLNKLEIKLFHLLHPL